jgi:predicted transcriptional regulator
MGLDYWRFIVQPPSFPRLPNLPNGSNVPNTPQQLSLGPLEEEILNILWEYGGIAVREIQDIILQDPNRELSAASITTVLQRLAKKGWVNRRKQQGVFCWHPLISRDRAQFLQAEDQLQRFLTVGSPAVMAAFADSLDAASVEQLDRITQQIKAAREARENPPCT